MLGATNWGHSSGGLSSLANGALLAGYVTVGDRAFISGNCCVHQFVRFGSLALMQGGAAVSKDVPPFTIARGINEICGLNVVGLRRAGLASEERLEVRRLYHALFRSGQNLRTALATARGGFSGAAATLVLDFVAESKRGVCAEATGGKARGVEAE